MTFAVPPVDQPPPPLTRSVRIGTRGSALALAQADLVAALLGHLGHEVAVRVIRTQGDADQRSPLAEIGGQGVFTSAIQDSLLRGEIDVAVHSAKDLPTTTHDDLDLVAFLSRQDARDVLVSRDGSGLADLPAGATVGTSSRRRMAQLRAVRPDLRVADLRGNIDTRIRRATEGDLDAVIIAAAGLHRMGWNDRISAYLALDTFVPAPGQAALALEVRARGRGVTDDDAIALAVGTLDEPSVRACLLAERAFLRALGVGCTMPIGAHATRDPDRGDLTLRAMVATADLDHARWETVSLEGDVERAAAGAARDLLGTVRRDRLARRAAAPRPSAGDARRTVLITRPGAAGERLAAGLRAAGFDAVVEPTIVVRSRLTPASDAGVRALLAGAGDWAVFPSAAAVDGVLARPDAPSIVASLPGTRVAAVGEGTGTRLRAAGVAVDLIPERRDANGMVAALIARGVSGRSVWLPQGNLARPDLAAGLVAAGAGVRTSVVYDVSAPDALSADTRGAITQGDLDAALFASPSAFRHLVELLGPDATALADLALIAIGETTADAIRAAGYPVAAVAATPDDPGLIVATATALAARPLPVSGLAP